MNVILVEFSTAYIFLQWDGAACFTGRRTTLPPAASACMMAWRIHHTAYVIDIIGFNWS